MESSTFLSIYESHFGPTKDVPRFDPNSFVHPSLLLNENIKPAKNVFEILAQTFDDSSDPFKDDRFNQYLFGFRKFGYFRTRKSYKIRGTLQNKEPISL